MAWVRPVRPSDKPFFRHGFRRLSPQSRYFRFFAARSSLGEAELRYLTEVDHESHVALVAVDDEAAAMPEGEAPPWEPRRASLTCGLGVARFVRVSDEPEVAEVAVTVVDEAQGRGVGTLLLDRLCGEARRLGIRRFRWEVLAENAAMRALVARTFAGVRTRTEGGALILEAPVPPSGSPRGLAWLAPGLFFWGATHPAVWAATQWWVRSFLERAGLAGVPEGRAEPPEGCAGPAEGCAPSAPAI
jgi:GNAT superfamily N-acetyltransferase